MSPPLPVTPSRNGVDYKVLIKGAKRHESLARRAPPTEYSRFQREWHITNDPCPFPHLSPLLSVCAESRKLQPSVDPCCSNPLRKKNKKQNCKELYGGNPARYLRGRMIPPPSPTYPDQIPSGRSHFGGKDLSLLITAPASHRRHRR